MEKTITININSIIDKLIVVNGDATGVKEQVEKALSGIIDSVNKPTIEPDREDNGASTSQAKFR